MKTVFIAILIMLIGSYSNAQDFKSKQLQFDRVKIAYQEKWIDLQKVLKEKNITNAEIAINAYKQERILELWIKNKDSKTYKLFKIFPFCESSGTLGPKIKEGDLQIPEGFYYINVFNPLSSYHLSLGINYPNEEDLKRSVGLNPGNEIFIHGDCVTVGCIPLSDNLIKEVYILAVEATNNGQKKIPVHIYPFRMNKKNLKSYSIKYPVYKDFWESLYDRNLLFIKNYK